MTQTQVPAPSATRRTPIYRDLVLLQLAALVFLLDQLTKFVVRAYLPYRDSFPEDWWVRLTHVHNTGSAFGIFQGQNTPLIAVSVIGIAILVMVYQSQARPTALLRLSLGLQIGGALGNLLDRLRLGYVTDFIDVGPWPVFNIADSSIVIGLLLLAYIFLWSGHRKDAAPADPPQTAAPPSSAPVSGPAGESDRPSPSP